MGENFKIPKKLLNSEGNSPNYFTITFNALYRDIRELMISKKLIRPPPQSSPKLNRDAKLLKDLIKLLQGIEFPMNEQHKKSLIREARYYRFNSIVAKLTSGKIIHDAEDEVEYILMNFKDINPDFFILCENYRNDYIDEPSLKKRRIERELEENINENENFNENLNENLNDSKDNDSHRMIRYRRDYLDHEGDERDLIVEIDSLCIGNINHSTSSNTKEGNEGNLISKLQILDHDISENFFEIVNTIEDKTNYKFYNDDNQFQEISRDGDGDYGFLHSNDTIIPYNIDDEGFLKFDSIDFIYDGESISRQKLTLKELPKSILIKKSYWKFNITFFHKQEKFIIDLIPIKIDAIPHTRGAMFGELIKNVN